MVASSRPCQGWGRGIMYACLTAEVGTNCEHSTVQPRWREGRSTRIGLEPTEHPPRQAARQPLRARVPGRAPHLLVGVVHEDLARDRGTGEHRVAAIVSADRRLAALDLVCQSGACAKP
eukprot:103597-Chlamydomonas_euryale.AAC.9